MNRFRKPVLRTCIAIIIPSILLLRYAPIVYGDCIQAAKMISEVVNHSELNYYGLFMSFVFFPSVAIGAICLGDKK